MTESEVPGPEFPGNELEKEQVGSSQEKPASVSPESEGPPPGFSEREFKHLQFLKDQAGKGKIGGLEDKPSEGREFVTHPKFSEEEQIDPAWKNLSPDLRTEFFDRFGQKVKLATEESLCVVPRGSLGETLLRLMEKHYPQFGLIIKEEANVEGNRLEDMISVLLKDPNKGEEIRLRLDNLMSDNPIMHALGFVFEEESDIPAAIKDLDKRGLIPEEAGRRLFAKYIGSMVEGLKVRHPNSPRMERYLERYRRELRALNAEPLSDEELKSVLLEKVIIPEFGPPASSSGEAGPPQEPA